MLTNVARRTGFLLLLILAACGAVLVAKQEFAPDLHVGWESDGLKISFHPEERRNNTWFESEPFYTGQDNSAREYGSARSDHAAIALEIGQCYTGYRDPSKWSTPTRAVLLFNLDQHLMRPLQIEGVSLNNEPPALNPFHTAAISFSDRISRDRVYFRKELEDNRWKAGLYQTLILVIGALATIAIGVKSTLPRDAKPSLSIAIGIFALSLSAAGTAISSMSSFDGSQSIALRDQRALSQLQQLHWRVASDVLSKTGLCKTPATDPGDAMKQVDAWKARLETILDNAVESVAQPGDLSRQTPTLPDTPRPAQPPEAQTAMSSGPSVSASAATSGSGASGRGL
jgi:hypothetical protein